jgi:H+/Cl- antiporter ClcA
MGGGAADWISSRKGLDEDESKATALSGMSGAFAGLFSSPLRAMLLTLERSVNAR